jgi:hypothetical protein
MTANKLTNYGGFPAGVNIRGLPILNSYPGKVFWVDSGAGSDGNKGTFSRPFGTMDYAVGQCTANNGDIIMVKPGHTETVTAAAGLDLDVAGVSFIGWGQGSDRPTINFTTVVGADMDVDAANITMSNFLFTGGIDALTGPIDINAADFALLNCETRDVTGQATDFIVTDANADRLLIEGWTHRGAAAAGANTAITIVGGDDITIRDFWIDGNFAVACIENVTTAAVNLSVYGNTQCFTRTRNAADVIVTAVATTTGNIGPNLNIRLQDNAANITECLVGADMQFYGPLQIVNLDGEMPFGVTAVGGIGMINKTASTDA